MLDRRKSIQALPSETQPQRLQLHACLFSIASGWHQKCSLRRVMDSQGTLVHEMLGKFIEESINRAVTEKLGALTEETERRVRAVIETGTSRLNAAMQKATTDIQIRVQQMVEHGLRSLTAEGERIVERTRERMIEATQKATEDLPVNIQQTLIAM